MRFEGSQQINIELVKMSPTESKTNEAVETSGTTTSDTLSSSSNGASSAAPEWVTADLFQEFLKKEVDGFKQIKSFEAKPALSAGENYMTLMLHVKIDAELESGAIKNLSYMLKVPISALKEMMSQVNVFDTELLMYDSIVPELEQLYRDVGVEVKFGAEMYPLKTPSEFGVVLLEDLRLRGFKNTNRLEGLDMEHIKCVLHKLAQWHAASAVRVETKGPYPTALTDGIYTDNYFALMKPMQESINQILMKCVKTFEGHELYIDSLEKFLPEAFDRMMPAAKVDPTEFNVLNHGDCWSNNIMFQYDADGKIKQTYFVDYQIPKYGSPAQDLLYFLISSTKYELKLKQFDYFINVYHKKLIENLKLLKYSKKMPSLKEIHMSLYKFDIWGSVTTIGVLAGILKDSSENANLENFLGDTDSGNNFKLLMYSNPRYRKHAEAILPWLYNRGALEC